MRDGLEGEGSSCLVGETGVEHGVFAGAFMLQQRKENSWPFGAWGMEKLSMVFMAAVQVVGSCLERERRKSEASK